MAKQEFMLKCGYEDGFEPKDLDYEKVDEIMDFLLEADLDDKQIPVKSDLQDIINGTEAFFAKHFTSLHSVLTVPKSNAGLYSLINPKPDSKENKEISVEVVEKSPFLIPVILRKDHSFQASIRKQEYNLGYDIGRFSPFIITNISLAKPFSMYSHVSYAHEIMHSQVDSVKGAVKNYHNLEVLSIFLEKLRALSLNTEVFREVEKRRLFFLGCSLRNFYTEYDNLDYVYYVSTLLAESLFDLYMNSCDEGRSIIMTYIDMIIAGELTLEEMLDNLGITLDNSLNVSAIQRNLSL